MKKLFFSAVGVLAIVGTALAVNNAKLTSTIYREGNTPGVCDQPVGRAITSSGTPGAIPDFATANLGNPCQAVFTITLD